MKKYLIVMTGFPGTGKTMTAKKLCQNFDNYILISQNDIRRQQGINKMHKTQEETLRKIDRLTRKYLDERKGVIFDSVNRHLFRRHQMYGIASCCGKKVLTLECVCSEEEAKKRIKGRPKGDNLISDPTNPKVYDKTAKFWEPVIKDFEYPGEDHVSYIIFDTERLKLKKKKISAGTYPFINKIEKILLER